MLETILSSGSAGRNFPKSGPGPKALKAGTNAFGYFGEVSDLEMGLVSEFRDLLDATTATNNTPGIVTNVWFKFIIDNKVLFFPKTPISAQMLLAELYTMRAVYDVDETYKPVNNPITGVALYTQTCHIQNPGSDLFKVLLMDALPAAAVFPNTSTVAVDATSELGKLFDEICNNGRPGTLNIKAYSPAQMTAMPGSFTANSVFVKEHHVAGATVYSGNHYLGLNQTLVSGVANRQSWRPILRFVPDADKVSLLFPAEKFSIQTEGIPEPVVSFGTVAIQLYTPTALANEVLAGSASSSGEITNQILQIAVLGEFPSLENSYPSVGAVMTLESVLIDIAGNPVEATFGNIAISDTSFSPLQLTGTGGSIPFEATGSLTQSPTSFSS